MSRQDTLLSEARRAATQPDGIFARLRVFSNDIIFVHLESEQVSWKNCQISAELEAEGLRGALESAFRVKFSEPIQTKTIFFDSFEWGIWFGEQLLFQAGGQLQLCGRDHDWIGDLQQSFPTSAKHVPHFAREFPRGPFRAELERLIGARSLQSVARLSMREQGVELFNQAQKTVFRFDLTDLFATENAPTPFYRLCHFQPLKGYEAEAAKAIKLLQTLGAREISEGPLALFLRESGSVPRRYTLRPTFDLTPELTIRETARRIIQKILAIARENERGICQDIDTEFLHDYRICMRKIRSILSLIPGIYPKEKMTELKAQFANYCEATNSLRDLDVYLLAREQYTEMLPGALRPPLEQVFHDFAKARRRALRRVTNHLGSPQYQTSIEAMERFFAALADLPETNVSKDPAGPLIAKSIYKRYRRIVKIERSLGADTPDAVLHEVRIHCKKLRYLIEFFSELLPSGETDRIEKQLRRLQTCLGLFNDCSVQQHALFGYWKGKRKQAGHHEDLALSIGGLVALLNDGQQQERGRFHDILDDFCSPQILRAMKAVCLDSSGFPVSPAPRSSTG